MVNNCDDTNYFISGLTRLGWTDGKTLTVDCRHTGGQPARMHETAMQLARAQPDLIFAMGNVAAFAAKQATSTIPILVCGMHGALGTGRVP
jgi:putative ABC transport system substrate-binding protein